MGKKTIRTALILVLENHRCAWEQEAEVRLYKYMRSIHCLSQGDTPLYVISTDMVDNVKIVVNRETGLVILEIDFSNNSGCPLTYTISN